MSTTPFAFGELFHFAFTHPGRGIARGVYWKGYVLGPGYFPVKFAGLFLFLAEINNLGDGKAGKKAYVGICGIGNVGGAEQQPVPDLASVLNCIAAQIPGIDYRLNGEELLGGNGQ